jgi:membrane protein
MKKQFRNVYELIKRSVKKYGKDDPLKLAGTTAYFTVFTMAPIIIIIVSITGFFIGQENIHDKVFVELDQLIGEKGTQYVRTLVDNYKGTEKSILGTIVGFLAFIFMLLILKLKKLHLINNLNSFLL